MHLDRERKSSRLLQEERKGQDASSKVLCYAFVPSAEASRWRRHEVPSPPPRCQSLDTRRGRPRWTMPWPLIARTSHRQTKPGRAAGQPKPRGAQRIDWFASTGAIRWLRGTRHAGARDRLPAGRLPQCVSANRAAWGKRPHKTRNRNRDANQVAFRAAAWKETGLRNKALPARPRASTTVAPQAWAWVGTDPEMRED